MNNSKRKPLTLSKTAFVIGLCGVVPVAIMVFLYGNPLYFVFFPLTYYFLALVFLIVGLLELILGIVALKRNGRNVFALLGLIFSIAWFIPIIYTQVLAHNLVSSTVSSIQNMIESPYYTCEDGRCTSYSYHNSQIQIHHNEEKIQTALPYATDWTVTEFLHAQTCTINGRSGDEWEKTIRGVVHSNRENVFADLKQYWNEVAYDNNDLRFSQTDDVLHIEILDKSYPEQRITVKTENDTVMVELNSACFEPSPGDYQEYIDYDLMKYNY